MHLLVSFALVFLVQFQELVVDVAVAVAVVAADAVAALATEAAIEKIEAVHVPVDYL